MSCPGTRFAAAAAGIVVLAVSLAGCGGHSSPTAPTQSPGATTAPGAPTATGQPTSPQARTPAPTPTLSSTSPAETSGPSKSPDPTQTPPVAGNSSLAAKYPEAAAKIPSAIQVVRDFYNGVNHEIDTGDETAVVKTYATSGCMHCISQVTEIKNMELNGDRIRGDHIHIISIDRAVADGGDSVDVVITGDEDAGDLLDSSGNLIRYIAVIKPTRVAFDIDVSRPAPIIIQTVLIGSR